MDKKEQIKKALLIVIIFLLSSLIGAGIGFLIIDDYGEKIGFLPFILRLLFGMILIVAAFFLQIIIHEFGHMLAALIRGWSFISFMIAGFVLTRRDGKFHLSRFNIPGAAGQCLMMPPEKGDTDFGIAFYNAGGVLMNIFSFLVALVVFLFFQKDIPYAASVLIYGSGIIGLILAIINGIPFSSTSLPNDGSNILNLRNDRFSTNVFLKTMEVIGLFSQGKTIHEVKYDYLCTDQEIDYSNTIHAMAVNFDLSLAIARKDFRKAHSILRDMQGHEHEMVEIYQHEMMLEKIYVYLVSPVEGMNIERLLDKPTLNYIKMQSAFRPTALRVQYVLALLHEHNEEKANQIYLKFQKVCDRYHIPGEIINEKELVEYARSLQKDPGTTFESKPLQ